MAYIGNSPANVGNYQIVDDISGSFNGSTTSFALASGSITITPAKSGQLLVGVNGVMQEPDDTGTNGFKVSGSNVVFSSAPASGDTFWAVYQGQAVDIGTPSAGTVDTTQLAADAVTGAKIADNAIDSEHYVDDSIDADHLANSINTDIATGVTAGTVAAAALPKAGGTMTGHLDVADSIRLRLGASNDLQIFHDTSNSYIENTGTGDLIIQDSGGDVRIKGKSNEDSIVANNDGSVELYYDNVKKFESTANGVTVTGGAVGTMTTDNDGSFDMSASNNFKCTPSGNFTLTFTNIVAQSGNILLINSGGHTVAAHANTKVDANILATITAAGTYLLAYFSDGTNVYMTNSAIYT